MNDLTNTIGRDPMMDRAIARVANHLYAVENSQGSDHAAIAQLETAARKLWSAAAQLDRQMVPAHGFRESIRDFVIACKEAEHATTLTGDCVCTDTVHAAFAEVVRKYRWFTLADQAMRIEEQSAYRRQKQAGEFEWV